jgi:hypothetical protein
MRWSLTAEIFWVGREALCMQSNSLYFSLMQGIRLSSWCLKTRVSTPETQRQDQGAGIVPTIRAVAEGTPWVGTQKRVSRSNQETSLTRLQ